MTELINYSESDISLDFATNAHRNTSFSPERRGQGVINDYMAHMEAVEREFVQWLNSDNAEQMKADLERYRQGYIRRYTDYLHSHSRIASQMITGAGGWTPQMVRSHHKKVEVSGRRLNEIFEYRDKVLDKLRRTYDPHMIAKAPISSDDADAIEKLQNKLDGLVRLQEMMKAANKIVRSKKLGDDEKIAELAKVVGNETEAHKVMTPDFAGRIGFASYQLSNNNANIRRIKQRIKSLERAAQRTDKEEVKEVAGVEVRVEENVEDNRIRLHFPGKPDSDTRTLLKRNGFRWSPRNKAWQRHLNSNGRYAVKHVLSQLAA